MASSRLMGLIFILVIATNIYAVTYDGIAIEYWAGQGQNSATIVVDFGLEQYAFGYRWDGTATGWDALEGLRSVALEDKLNVFETDYGDPYGIIVDDLSYLDAVKYDYGETAFAGWAYYYSFDGTNWTSSGDSCLYRNFSSGDWDCWLWSEFSFSPFGPLREPGQPVPEPATLVLLALGGLLLRRRRT